MPGLKLRQGPNGQQVVQGQASVCDACLPEFSDCACPPPLVVAPADPNPPCSNMLGWAVWLSEVLVGIDSPNEDIAANYVRQAAIQFAEEAQVIRRVHTVYPPFNPGEAFQIPVGCDERFGGVVRACIEGCCGKAVVPTRESWDGIRFMDASCRCVYPTSCVEIEFFVVPTEDALWFDEVLYRNFRRPIAEAARAMYVRAVHFRDRGLLASVQPPGVFERDILKARHSLAQLTSVGQRGAHNALS